MIKFSLFFLDLNVFFKNDIVLLICMWESAPIVLATNIHGPITSIQALIHYNIVYSLSHVKIMDAARNLVNFSMSSNFILEVLSDIMD